MFIYVLEKKLFNKNVIPLLDKEWALLFFLGFKSSSCRIERKEMHNTESPYSLFSHGT